nr:unnamed protein product [Spirometra erinaceieuropaei]
MDVEAESICREFLSLVAGLSNTKPKLLDQQHVRSSIAKLAFPIFRRSVFESRKAAKGIFRPRVKSDLKATIQNPWPRNPTEKLISAYFDCPLEQFAAVLEALQSVLADVSILTSAEEIKASMDPVVCDVIEELFLAGFTILCPNESHTLARFREVCEDSQNAEETPKADLMLLDFIAVDEQAYVTPDLLTDASDEDSCVKPTVHSQTPRTNLRGLLDFMKMCLAYDQHDIFGCLYESADRSLKDRDFDRKNPNLHVFSSRLRQFFSIHLYKRNVQMPPLDYGLSQNSRALAHSLDKICGLRRHDRWKLTNLAFNSNVLDSTIIEKDLKINMEILKVLLDYGRKKMSSIQATILVPLKAPRWSDIPVWLLLLMSAQEHLTDVEKIKDVESFAVQWTTQFLYLIRCVVGKLARSQYSDGSQLQRLLLMVDVLMWKTEDGTMKDGVPDADGWRTSAMSVSRKFLKHALEKIAWIKQLLADLMFSMETFHLLGRKRAGVEDVTPHLNDKKLKGTGVMYPANTSEVIEVNNLIPDEEYLFAVAFTQKNRPPSEKPCLGPSTAPILASPTLCEKIALGHIAQIAFDHISTCQLEEAEKMIASTFLKKQLTEPPAGSLHTPYWYVTEHFSPVIFAISSLSETAMTNSGKILQMYCAQAIFLNARARLLNRSWTLKNESSDLLIKEQLLDIELCHRLTMSLELNMQHKSFVNAMAVIETIALLLGPYLRLQFEIQDITDIQRICLTQLEAISENFAKGVQRRKSSYRMPSTECIRLLAHAYSRSLLRLGNKASAVEVLERAKTILQNFALPQSSCERSASKTKIGNDAAYTSNQSDATETALPLNNISKEDAEVLNDQEATTDTFETRRLKDLRIIDDLITYLTSSLGKPVRELFGNEEPMKVYSAIETLSLKAVFTEGMMDCLGFLSDKGQGCILANFVKVANAPL